MADMCGHKGHISEHYVYSKKKSAVHTEVQDTFFLILFGKKNFKHKIHKESHYIL